jgi:hypothetical protein
MEIFLMVTNGCGYARILSIVASWPHTVTLKYLHDDPDELHAFFDFDRVQQYKLMKPIFDTFGESALPQDLVADPERRYTEVLRREASRAHMEQAGLCFHGEEGGSDWFTHSGRVF